MRVVFWAWGLAWSVFEPVNAVFPVARDLLYAVWLVPAVLAPLIVRKPGAALYAELVAAIVSAHPGVNHNYEREHRFNLWFVMTGADAAAIAAAIFAVTAARSGPLWSTTSCPASRSSVTAPMIR